MRYEIKSYNDFFFTLEIIQFGAGQTGLSPDISIKKYNSNEYWNGTSWSATYTVFSMLELDSVNLPGIYGYNFSSGPNPIDLSDDTGYLVKLSESTNVTVNRLDNLLNNEYSIVSNIRNFFDSSTGFDAALSSIGSVDSVVNTVDSNMVSLEPDVKAEISNSILNANIWNPIVNTSTLNNEPSNRDTIARAIVSSYLSNVYKTPYDVSTSEDFYTCTNSDSEKFYSSKLPSLSEMEDMVGNEVILIKGWDGYSQPDMSIWKSLKMRVGAVGLNGGGKYLELTSITGNTESFTSGQDTIIIKNQTLLSLDDIADSVWEEPVSSHSTDGTFGMLTRIIAGLVHFNHRIKDTEYDQTGRMTGCRVLLYSSPEDADLDINPFTTIIISSEYNSGNNMSSYLATKE
jgi:hypothetical protein